MPLSRIEYNIKKKENENKSFSYGNSSDSTYIDDEGSHDISRIVQIVKRDHCQSKILGKKDSLKKSSSCDSSMNSSCSSSTSSSSDSDCDKKKFVKKHKKSKKLQKLKSHKKSKHIKDDEIDLFKIYDFGYECYQYVFNHLEKMAKFFGYDLDLDLTLRGLIASIVVWMAATLH